nr:phage portal protein [Streptomyces sp. SID3212]
MKVFSEGEFIFRDRKNKGNYFGGTGLGVLETPWPGGTTGELLARMEQDASLAGNSYWAMCDDSGRIGKAAAGKGLRLTRLRPDWITIVISSSDASNNDPFAADCKVIGYLYSTQLSGMAHSNGFGQANDILLLPDEVCHYSPIPDPVARFRGMSWLTPVLREVSADSKSTIHKESFLKNAAVPNMAIKFSPETSKDDFDEFVAKFKGSHQGAWNAYKTLFLLGGADVTPLSMDFRQLEFSQTVGKGESRIAAAAGVPPSWVGLSEGLQGSGLNQSMYAAARRRFADGTIRPLWRIAAASMQNIVITPNDQSQLWYDDSQVAFLREDQTDLAEINRIQANAIDSFIKSGFKPDAAVQAVLTRDLRVLTGQHTGLVSVQMQPPVDPNAPKAIAPPPANPGSGPNGN